MGKNNCTLIIYVKIEDFDKSRVLISYNITISDEFSYILNNLCIFINFFQFYSALFGIKQRRINGIEILFANMTAELYYCTLF